MPSSKHLFEIAKTAALPILGLRAGLDMNLAKLVLLVKCTSILKEFQDVFKGIGEFPGECGIHINPSAVPIVYPAGRHTGTHSNAITKVTDHRMGE